MARVRSGGRLWLLALAAVAIEVCLFLLTTRRFVVEGRSMLPALEAGDRVVVSIYGFRWRRPRVGEIVVVRRRGSSRHDVKRIAAGPDQAVDLQGRSLILSPGQWFLLGDNASQSTDSRQLGPVEERELVGPVWFKY